MKENIKKLILDRINASINERNKVSEANDYEENKKRDNLTREITAWQIMLLIIEKLNK